MNLPWRRAWRLIKPPPPIRILHMLCELTADDLNWNSIFSRSCSTATCWTEMKFFILPLFATGSTLPWMRSRRVVHCVGSREHLSACRPGTYYRSSTLPAEQARTYCVRLCPLLECVSCQRARQVRTTYRSRARCPHARYVLRTAPARCPQDRHSCVAGSCSSRQMWRAGLQDQIDTRQADGWKTQLSSV